MTDEKQVVNESVTETTPAPDQQEKPQQETSEVVADAKTPQETADRFDKHPRFRELNAKAKEAEQTAMYWKSMYDKNQQSASPAAEQDLYANMPLEEREATKKFIDKFVIPEVEKRYAPFVQEVQMEKLNKQVAEAKEFSKEYGIDFDEKLPEVVDYLSRPENKGRLTAKEAIQNLYFNDITGSVRRTAEDSYTKQKDELTQKKKEANTLNTSIPQGAVVHTDELRRSKMSSVEKLNEDIAWAIEQGKKGEKNPKVR